MKEKLPRLIPAIENDLIVYENKKHNLLKGDFIYIPQGLGFKGALWEVSYIKGGTVHFVPNIMSGITPKMTFKELIQRETTIEVCKKSEVGQVFASHALDENIKLENSLGLY